MRAMLCGNAVLLLVSAAHLAAQCPDGSPPPCVAATWRPSLAVLSFEFHSRDTNDVFLAEGLSDDIAHRLGELRRLTVRSRETVRRLPAASSLSIHQLGRALRATYVLSGRARAVGTRVHFVVELTETEGGRVEWSRRFDVARDGLLQVQTTIVQSVAQTILRRLSIPERQQLSLVSSPSEEAFARLARGKAFLARRVLPAAISELRAAVHADSGTAAGWAALAQAYALCVFLGPQSAVPCTARSDSLRELATVAARTALRLDSTLAESWLADALTRVASPIGSPDYPRALASLRQAEALGDRSAELLHTIGSLLLTLGTDDTAAIRYLRTALTVDPGRGVTYIYLSRAAWIQGRYAESLALLDTAEVLEQGWDTRNDRWRALLAMADTTRIRDAWSRLGQSLRLSVSDSTAVRARWIENGFVRLAAGDTIAANVVADSLVAFSSQSPWAALLLMRLGRRMDAEGVVRRFRPGGAATWMTLRSPAFDGLRSLEVFRVYLDRARAVSTASPR